MNSELVDVIDIGQEIPEPPPLSYRFDDLGADRTQPVTRVIASFRKSAAYKDKLPLFGGREFDTFSIDIVDSRRELVGQSERHPIPRLVDTDDFTPVDQRADHLSDQIADKLCAIYRVLETGGVTSRHHRLLVDFLLIAMFLPIDLATTVEAVAREHAVRDIPHCLPLSNPLARVGPFVGRRLPATAP